MAGYVYAATTADSVVTYPDSTWRLWSGGTTTGSTTANITWQTWVYDGTMNVPVWGHGISSSGSYVYNGGVVPQWTPTAAELVEQARRRNEARQHREEAERKADDLLESLLNDEQVAYYKRTGFVIVTSSSGRRYEVGARCLVKLLGDDGLVERQWCWHSPESYPRGDRIAATMLALLADEAQLWTRGNVHTVDSYSRTEVQARLATA